jgi:2-dehydropantoate 2-reductase
MVRVAVLGSGAMGAIFGACFCRTGADVIFFDNRSDVAAAINHSGLVLDGVMGKATFAVRATTDPADLGTVDIALVLVDSSATAAVARVAAISLAETGFAVTLQNGIGNWETLVAELGPGRVIAGSTFNSGANLGPGLARHTNLGPTVIGEIDGTISSRVTALARQFEAGGLPVEISDNVQGHVWSKFVHNCAINPVSAVTRLRPGEIARSPYAARLLDCILDEVLAVVAASAVRLPESDPRRHIHDHCWERYNRPSMLQHLEGGRRTEIDALNGAAVARAHQFGIAAPFNEAIVMAVKSLEAAAARPSPDIDETTLEETARDNPRGDRWG